MATLPLKHLVDPSGRTGFLHGDPTGAGAISPPPAPDMVLTFQAGLPIWSYPDRLETGGNSILEVRDPAASGHTLTLSGPPWSLASSGTLHVDTVLRLPGAYHSTVPAGDDWLASTGWLWQRTHAKGNKVPVRATTSSAADLSGLVYQAASDGTPFAVVWSGPAPTFDGTAIQDGDRVLVRHGGLGNGIFRYDAAAGGLVRDSDADNDPTLDPSGAQLRGGIVVGVAEGSRYAGTLWTLRSPSGSVTIGTDIPVFELLSVPSSGVTAGPGLELSGGTLSVNPSTAPYAGAAIDDSDLFLVEEAGTHYRATRASIVGRKVSGVTQTHLTASGASIRTADGAGKITASGPVWSLNSVNVLRPFTDNNIVYLPVRSTRSSFRIVQHNDPDAFCSVSASSWTFYRLGAERFVLQSGATDVSFDVGSSTMQLFLPTGTTAQRPAAPPAGTIRYHQDLKLVELWNGTQWIQISHFDVAAPLVRADTVSLESDVVYLDWRNNTTDASTVPIVTFTAGDVLFTIAPGTDPRDVRKVELRDWIGAGDIVLPNGAVTSYEPPGGPDGAIYKGLNVMTNSGLAVEFGGGGAPVLPDVSSYCAGLVFDEAGVQNFLYCATVGFNGVFSRNRLVLPNGDNTTPCVAFGNSVVLHNANGSKFVLEPAGGGGAGTEFIVVDPSTFVVSTGGAKRAFRPSNNPARPASPQEGQIRFDQTVGKYEAYTGTSWGWLFPRGQAYSSAAYTGSNVFTGFFSSPPVASGTTVFVDQTPLRPSQYTISGTTLTITGYSFSGGETVWSRYMT